MPIDDELQRDFNELLRRLKEAGVSPRLALVMLDTGLTAAEIEDLGGLTCR